MRWLLPVRVVTDAIRLVKAVAQLHNAMATCENPYIGCYSNGELDKWLD